MKIVREDQQTFLFREKALVSETKRLECVTEKKAMELFFRYLEHVGPNIVLVGVDEDSIGMLLQKLESHNAKNGGRGFMDSTLLLDSMVDRIGN